MYELKIKVKKADSELIFEEPLTIENATTVKERLQNSLDKTDILNVCHDKVKEFDLTYMQMLISAQKTSSNSGKTFTLCSNHPREFTDFIKESGFPVFDWMSLEKDNKRGEKF